MRAYRAALTGVACVAVAGLVTSCAASTDNAGGNTSGGNSSVTVAETNSFTSFNGQTPEANVEMNTKVAYLTRGMFNYVDNQMKIVKNEKFGKYEKISDNPLTVKYTVNEGVKWSDGNAFDAADLMLSWAVRSGWYDDATTGPDGKVSGGTKFFPYAGDTTGMNSTLLPEVGADGRSITVKFTKPFADWESPDSGISGDIVPAHVLAKKAGLDEKGFLDLLKANKKGDPKSPRKIPKLAEMGKVWNEAFVTKSMPSDPSLALSAGPYIVSAAVPDQSITLKKNPDCKWAPGDVKIDEIVIRTIKNAPAMVTALRNSESDIISPQASGDTVKQLKEIGDKIDIQTGDETSFDHLDLQQKAGAFKDKNVREAFLKTVPRQDIVDKVIKDVNPNAKVLNSRLVMANKEAYAKQIAGNDSAKWEKPDVAGAKALLKGATPTVKILYNKENQKRLDTYTLIARSATEAGFKVVDGGLGAGEWSKALDKGGYDASIFGWVDSGVGVSGIPQIYKTGGGSNFNAYSNPAADKLMDEIVTTVDPAKQDDLRLKIDKYTWEDAYGLPLFQTAGVTAVNKRVKGVKFYPGINGVYWNVWEWTL